MGGTTGWRRLGLWNRRRDRIFRRHHQGIYEPDDLKGHDGFFAISMIAAPAGACLVAWLYRHGLLGESGLASAALAGMVAGLIFLGPSMAYFFSRLDNLAGLKRLASLLLHRDETAGEAIVSLNAAIRLAPDDASLSTGEHWPMPCQAARLPRSAIAASRTRPRLDRTDDQPGLACASARPRERGCGSLRTGRARQCKRAMGWIGLAVAKLKLGEAAQATAALDRVPEASGKHSTHLFGRSIANVG